MSVAAVEEEEHASSIDAGNDGNARLDGGGVRLKLARTGESPPTDLAPRIGVRWSGVPGVEEEVA